MKTIYLNNASEVSSNLMGHGMAIVMNYISWLEQQGINPKL